jgi:hypothetical protein
MAKLNRWRGRRLKVDFRHGTISRRVRFGSSPAIENSEPNFRKGSKAASQALHNSLNFARQTDHGFPLTIAFDRPSKPRIESARHRKIVGRSTRLKRFCEKGEIQCMCLIE